MGWSNTASSKVMIRDYPKKNQGQSSISCLKNITLTLILSLLLLWSCVVIIVALSYPLLTKSEKSQVKRD